VTKFRLSLKARIIHLPIWFQIRRRMLKITRKLSKQKHLKWTMTSFKTKNQTDQWSKHKRESNSKILRAPTRRSHLLHLHWVFFPTQIFNIVATNQTTMLRDKTFSWKVNHCSRMTFRFNKWRKKSQSQLMTIKREAFLITKVALSHQIHFHKIRKHWFQAKWRLT
jgi:hypothetical protein